MGYQASVGLGARLNSARSRSRSRFPIRDGTKGTYLQQIQLIPRRKRLDLSSHASHIYLGYTRGYHRASSSARTKSDES